MNKRIVEFSKADDLVFALTEEVCKPRKLSAGEAHSFFSAKCDRCGTSLDSWALMISATMIVTAGKPTVPRCPHCGHDRFVAILVGVSESDIARLEDHKFFATLANPNGGQQQNVDNTTDGVARPEKRVNRDERNTMNKPEGITTRTDISGSCDICNAHMPPSGGVITARAMKLLVEGGFDPEPTCESGPMASIARRMEELGVSREAQRARMKQKILNEQLGDFGACPNCFERAINYCV